MFYIIASYPNSSTTYGFNKNENKFYPYADGRDNQTYDDLHEAQCDLACAIKDAGENATVSIVNEKYEVQEVA